MCFPVELALAQRQAVILRIAVADDHYLRAQSPSGYKTGDKSGSSYPRCGRAGGPSRCRLRLRSAGRWPPRHVETNSDTRWWWFIECPVTLLPNGFGQVQSAIDCRHRHAASGPWAAASADFNSSSMLPKPWSISNSAGRDRQRRGRPPGCSGWNRRGEGSRATGPATDRFAPGTHPPIPAAGDSPPPVGPQSQSLRRRHRKRRQVLIVRRTGRMEDALGIPKNGAARVRWSGLPTVLPELRLFAHELIEAAHVRHSRPVKEPVKGVHQLGSARRIVVPGRRRPRGVTQPESLRVQTRVCPAGNERAHQVGPGALPGRRRLPRDPRESREIRSTMPSTLPTLSSCGWSRRDEGSK